MAVAIDKITDLGSFTDTPDPFTASHTPVGTPRGVSVFIFSPRIIDYIDGTVSYGGVALARDQWAAINGTEDLECWHYFLGSGVPTGTQTVSIAHTGAVPAKYAVCVTYTASGDLEIKASGKIETEPVDDPSLALDSGASTALRIGALYTGTNSAGNVAPGTGYTEAYELGVAAANVQSVIYETTPSSGSTSIAWTTQNEETALIGAAIGEVAAAGSVGSSAGAAVASGTGASTHAAVFASAGVGAAAGVGKSTHAAVGASAGVGAAAGTGASTVAAVASSAGVGAATGVAGVVDNVGAAAGTSTVAGVGASTHAAVASSTGVAAAAGVSASTAASVGAAAGVGAASGTGVSAVAAVASSSGVATATGVGYAAGFVGDAAGTATAAGVGAWTFAGVGAASGIAAATGVGASTGGSVGSAAGQAYVFGISEDAEVSFHAITAPFVQTLVASFGAPDRATLEGIQLNAALGAMQLMIGAPLIDSMPSSYGAPTLATLEHKQLMVVDTD